MINNFTLAKRPKIVFGNDFDIDMNSDFKPYKNVLVVYGQNSIKDFGIYDQVISNLDGLNIFELSGVTPNPRLSIVKKGICMCKSNEIDLILAIGGGSVIDAAKAISIGAKSDFDVWDLITKKHPVTSSIDLATVITMIATGSETNDIFVILNDEIDLKRSLKHDLAYPKFAYMNPEFTTTVPLRHTISGIVDTISHIIEQRYNGHDIKIYDTQLDNYFKRTMEVGSVLINDLTNYQYRAEHMLLGMSAYNGDFRTILGGDWACHGLDYGLASRFDNFHGEGLSIIMPNWLVYIANNFKNLKPISDSFRYVFNLEGSDSEVVLEGSSCLRDYFSSIGAPKKLSDIGIYPNEDDIEIMVEKSQFMKPLGGTYPLNENDIRTIYKNICNLEGN